MWQHGAPNRWDWPHFTLLLRVDISKSWTNCLNVVLILKPELRVLVVVSIFYPFQVGGRTVKKGCLTVSPFYLLAGTPLHSAAKERNKEAIKFLIENGAFLPAEINDTRFNPPLHYCPGLEWAYEEMKRIQQESWNSSAGEGSYSSES